jgi:hypothetical protein
MNKEQRLAWLPDVVIDDMRDAIEPWCAPTNDREALTCLYQEFAGLTVDGWPGVKTAQALYGSGLPIARDRAQLIEQVGMDDATWTRSTGRRIRWTGRLPDVVRIELHNGDYARVHRLFAAEFAALFRVACEASGYTPESTQTYNPRRISGEDALSYHSYGVAVDFDPQLNPMGGVIKKGPRKGELALVAQHPMFLEVWRWAGWTCGHDWRMIDSMHAQRKR